MYIVHVRVEYQVFDILWAGIACPPPLLAVQARGWVHMKHSKCCKRNINAGGWGGERKGKGWNRFSGGSWIWQLIFLDKNVIGAKGIGIVPPLTFPTHLHSIIYRLLHTHSFLLSISLYIWKNIRNQGRMWKTKTCVHARKLCFYLRRQNWYSSKYSSEELRIQCLLFYFFTIILI